MLAAGWFCACSSDGDGISDMPDVPEAEELPMTFGGSLGEGEEATRAGKGLEEADIRSFRVYGVKSMSLSNNGTAGDTSDDYYTELQTVFDGYTVSHDATGGWLYDNVAGQYLKYWDMSACAYSFMAYAPANATIKMEAVGTEYAKRFSFNADCSSEEAIKHTPYFSTLRTVDSKIAGGAQFGEPVVMEFMQPFCQVRFMLVDEQNQPLTKNSIATPFISDIAFGQANNINTEGDINTEGYIPTFVGVRVDYPLRYQTKETVDFQNAKNRTIRALTTPYESHASADDYAFVAEADKEKWHTLIPYDSHGAYHMTLSYGGEQREAVVPEQYMAWQPGYRYTYVFKISADGSAVYYAPELYSYTKWEAGYTDETQW